MSVRRCLAAWGLALALSGSVFAGPTVSVPLADGFDFPCGKPNGAGYYTARGVRLVSPVHYGEDWNGRSGGDTDLGDPIYTIGDGVVTWAYDVHKGWGNVVIIRHAYRDPATQQIKFCDSLYGHLLEIMVKVGQQVRRGQQIGRMGSNNGMYPAHLHLEVRHNINIGMLRDNFPRNFENWAVPTEFINRYRRLSREWKNAQIPTGTYPEYEGFKGL